MEKLSTLSTIVAELCTGLYTGLSTGRSAEPCRLMAVIHRMTPSPTTTTKYIYKEVLILAVDKSTRRYNKLTKTVAFEELEETGLIFNLAGGFEMEKSEKKSVRMSEAGSLCEYRIWKNAELDGDVKNKEKV